MAQQKRKPGLKKQALQKPVEEQLSVQAEEGDVTRWLQSAQPSVAHVRSEPGPTEEASILAQMVRNYQGTRDALFEVASGVVLMYGYSGLSRVFQGYHHIHIATVDELAAMSDQQIYDAVMRAGGKR